MRNIRQQLCILTGSVLLFGTSIAQAGQSIGTITFSPAAVSATAVPMLGSTLLILLSLLLVFIAFVAFRKRQNGVASVIAGALVLAAVASAGGGATLFHKAYAASADRITDPAGEELQVAKEQLNIYTNESGVPMTIGAPFFTSTGCNTGWDELDGACVVGSALADGAHCQIDCENPDPENWAGSWQLTCELVSWNPSTLCANCQPIDIGASPVFSCETCANDTFTNVNGTLVCADDPP